MKLVIAIVDDEDAPKLVDKLMENKFRVTKLASTGGFLRAGNTTLLIGVSKEKVDKVIDIIKSICKSRKQVTTTATQTAFNSGTYIPYPIEVQVGGATIFVVDVDKFEKV